ncbi:MAG: GDSL-type esterase/lipase family protein [Bacteroidota bacterium]
MKFKYSLLLLLATFATGIMHANATNADTLFAQNLTSYGRSLLNNNNELELISSAVHFGASFTGVTCKIYVSLPDKSAHSYLQYELDGVYQKRIRIEGKSTNPIIITAPVGGNHKIWIFKCTEATSGAIRINKLAAVNIKPIKPSKAPLIEFIGNSITCGAAADDSEIPCGTGDYIDHHNAYLAYGPRLARTLGANYILSSVSGIGVYRNWNSDGPTMPQIYENTELKWDSPLKWDFSKYSPKVVSIALGTNDFSNGDGVKPRMPFDPEKFIASYINFVKLVKSKYPKARVALLSSPMVKLKNGKVLEDCITAVKNKINADYPGDKPAEVFFFPPMEAHGCGGHPSVEDHAIMAEQATSFFKTLLN